MILAAIDIGTNSVKLLVARSTRGRLSPVSEAIAIPRLGEGFHETGRISRMAAERTVAWPRRMS